MPAASRDAYFALRAVNAELASVKDGQVMRFRGQQQSSSRQQQEESSLALKMRMQWWRDAVAEICLDDDEKKRQSTKKQNLSPEAVLLSNLSISRWSSPAVRSLDRAHQQCGGFTKRFLERLIDARETDLDVVQHATVEEAVQYAEDTVGSLLYLTLETVGVRDDQADEVASHAGKAIGLITALRSTPFRLQHGEIPIPFELLRPNFPVHLLLDEEAQLSEEDAQMLKEAVQHMASMAWEHALIAREMQGQIPAAAKPCLLPLVPSLHYLGRLRRADYDLFHSKLLQDPSARWKLLLLLGRTWLTGVL
jgi:NADH dehydrogenase [ubiquinone] 1 alpha subcomplex assembly factor 6